MNNGYIKTKFTTADVNRERKKVHVGDKLKYKTTVTDILNEKVSVVVWRKVIVTRKHNHLVEVEYIDRSNTFPVKTMTYREIAFQKAGIDYDELRGKKK